MSTLPSTDTTEFNSDFPPMPARLQKAMTPTKTTSTPTKALRVTPIRQVECVQHAVDEEQKDLDGSARTGVCRKLFNDSAPTSPTHGRRPELSCDVAGTTKHQFGMRWVA